MPARPRIKFFLLCGLFLVTAACSRIAKEFPAYPVHKENAADQLRATEDAYELARQSRTRGDQMGLAKKGMTYAEQCILLRPKQAACHFFLALNTGLYYEAKVLGYPSGMIRIARAAERVIELDPHYENAGAYRVLGQLFLKAPAFNIGSNEVTRDLERSRTYLEQGIDVAPTYPENHLFLAETLVAMDSWTEAARHIEIAIQLLQKHKYPASDLKSWKRLIQRLKKKLPKDV